MIASMGWTKSEIIDILLDRLSMLPGEEADGCQAQILLRRGSSAMATWAPPGKTGALRVAPPFRASEGGGSEGGGSSCCAYASSNPTAWCPQSKSCGPDGRCCDFAVNSSPQLQINKDTGRPHHAQ